MKQTKMKNEPARMPFGARAIAAAAVMIASAFFAAAADAGTALVLVRVRAEGDAPTRAEFRDAAETAAREAGAVVERVYWALSEATGSAYALVSSEAGDDELAASLRALPSVLSVSRQVLLKPELQPEAAANDTYFSQQWGLEAIGAPKAWELSRGRDDVYVAVLDQGYTKHDDLDANIDRVRARDFALTDGGTDVTDSGGHGIQVAGVVGAVTNNGQGIAGVCPNVRIIPIRVMSSNGEMTRGTEFADAADYVAELSKTLNVVAVNISAGGYETGTSVEDYVGETYMGAMVWEGVGGIELRALSALDKAPLLALSAGNDGVRHEGPLPYELSTGTVRSGSIHFPSAIATLPNTSAVSVAAAQKLPNGTIRGAEYTNWSDKSVDIAAPGSNITTTHLGGGYTSTEGTSVAAPHVAGAAALLASYMLDSGSVWGGTLPDGRPFNGRTLREILLDSADNIRMPRTFEGYDLELDAALGAPNVSRSGLLRVDRALERVRPRISGITLTPDDNEITVGASAAIKFTVAPAGANAGMIDWTAEPRGFVSLTPGSGSVVVKGIAAGTVTIKATATDGGGAEASVAITVNEPAADHTHSFGGDWYTDDENTLHWQLCEAGDGARGNEGEHLGGEYEVYETQTASGHARQCEVCRLYYDIAEHTASSAGWGRDGGEHWRVCEDCGAEMDRASHTAGAGIGSDKDGHWPLCAACSGAMAAVSHDWGAWEPYGDAHKRLCETCSEADGPLAHEWEEGWQSGTGTHWKLCAICGAQGSQATHEDADGDEMCDTCGAGVAGHAHKYGLADWKSDGIAHWHVCEICGDILDEADHDNGWRSDAGGHWAHCSICGAEGNRAGHRQDAAWASDALDHWHECGVCGVTIGREAHSDADRDGKCDTCGRVTVTASAPNPSEPEYKMTEGNGDVWDGGDMTFRSEADLSKFVRVEVDGAVVPANKGYYTVTEGSTVVTLSESYLWTLSAGTHRIAIISTDGRAEGKFSTDYQSPFGVSGGVPDGGCAAGAAATALAFALAAAYRRRNGRR